MLKLCHGGSQLTFSQDVKCCIKSCGATRERNRILPFYTFPSNPELCKEWLNKIQLDDSELINLDKLHITHMVCSKHFQLKNGGMMLCVDDENTSIEDSNLVICEEDVSSKSCSTQTYEDDWIRSLKEEHGVEILCGKHIQCRVCASVSVQALNIYNKCNEQLHLENLINKLLPIKVKPTDKKPLNVCVQCIYKLRQFIDLINCSNNNDQNFDSLNILNKSNKKMSVEKKRDNEKIIVITIDSDNENNDTNVSTDLIKKPKTNDHLDKSKLDKKNSYPYDFIKKESRIHKIKILLATKISNVEGNPSSANDHNKEQCFNKSNTNKVIDVEFTSHYIICHGREWIHKISIDNSQLKYSQGTINHILEVIRSTMKKQCEKNNSKVVPLVLDPSQLDRVMVSRNQQQIRTESVIINGKKYVDDKIHKQDIKTSLKKNLVCTECGLNFENKQLSFTSHIKKCQPRPCRFCGENVMPHEKLLLHEKEHRKPSEDGFVCHLCGRQFKTSKGLNCHYKKHKNYDRFSCTSCDLQFSNGYGLRKHLHQNHKETFDEKKTKRILTKQQKCSKCEQWLSSKLALRVHMRIHLPIEERMKTCPDCKKVFVNARRFKMHVETHGPCPIKCLECPRSFPTQEHLDNHMHNHKITEPVFCDICQRNFKTRTTLKNHIARVHQGFQYVQKTFTCLFCKIIFANKEELKSHINIHTIEEKAQAFTGDEYGKFQCDVSDCNKFFLFKSRLSIHKIYHHSKPCSQCGKYTTDNLTNHYCKPKGSRALQYSCKHCTKRFSSKQRLNLHERTHGLDYRFQCTVCSKLFTKMSALNTHLNLHSNIQKFTCNICGKICKLASTLKSHIKTCGKNISNKSNSLNPYTLHNYAITLPSTETHFNLPLNIQLPNIDEQSYFICDVSQHMEISQDINVSNQQLQ